MNTLASAYEAAVAGVLVVPEDVFLIAMAEVRRAVAGKSGSGSLVGT